MYGCRYLFLKIPIYSGFEYFSTIKDGLSIITGDGFVVRTACVNTRGSVRCRPLEKVGTRCAWRCCQCAFCICIGFLTTFVVKE